MAIDSPDPSDQVILLDRNRQPSGTSDRLSVHTATTPLHLAFSTYLVNSTGQVLLTRRALGKKTWPGVWTNSACGHPRPGEQMTQSIQRRVFEELGVTVRDLTCALPEFSYRATDASGVVENEVCPVYVGRIDGTLYPDPAEVMDVAWVEWPDLVTAVTATPHTYSPWAAEQVPQLASFLDTWNADPQRLPAWRSTLADIDGLIAAQTATLARRWQDLCPPGSPDVIEADDLPGWVTTLQGTGGKRLRSAMCHAGFLAAGGRTQTAGYTHMVRAAAALEILHLFALVHDDVMDESLTRRGAPAAHVQAAGWHQKAAALGDPDVFGRNLAVLVGDLAHSMADAMAADLPAPLREEWDELSIELIAGQRADLTAAAAGRRDLEHANFIARIKSGAYTIWRPLDLGALAAGASPRVRTWLREYGEHVGLAFALRDDYLGIWGDPARTGKPVGDDLRSCKATTILALARTMLDAPGREILRRVEHGWADDVEVDELRRRLDECGVRDQVETQIEINTAAALAVLRRAAFTPAATSSLTSLAERVAWRTS